MGVLSVDTPFIWVCAERMENLPAKTNKFPLILYYVFKLIALLAGCGIMFAGYKLFLSGLAGNINIAVNYKGISGKLINGSPGAVVFLGGFFIALRAVWIQMSFAPPGNDNQKGISSEKQKER